MEEEKEEKEKEEEEDKGEEDKDKKISVMTRATSPRLKSRIYTMSCHEGHLQQLVDLPRLKVLSHSCMAPQHPQAATTISPIVWLIRQPFPPTKNDLLFCIPIPTSPPT